MAGSVGCGGGLPGPLHSWFNDGSAKVVLVAVTNPLNPPASCLAGATPGTYIQLRVTYTYAPLFGDLSVTNLLGTSISKTSYMRLQ